MPEVHTVRCEERDEHLSLFRARGGFEEFDARMRNIGVDVLREDLIDRRAAYLLGDSATVPLGRVPQDDPEGGGDGLDG